MANLADYNFQAVAGWERLPEGFHHRDVCGVATDSQDRVYVLTRGEPRIIIYEKDGTFLTSWAEGLFTNRTHAIRIGPDDSVYCVDDGDHTVRKFNTDGSCVLTLGTPGQASDTGFDGAALESITRGGPPFNRPTCVAIAGNGDLYISDGYGNARVHRFTKGGELIRSWGEPGTGPGQFNLPHGIWCTDDGRVLVADRENDRIQIFDVEGKYLSEWTHVQRPTDIFVDSDGLIYVTELAWLEGQKSFRNGPISEKAHSRLSILDSDGRKLSQIGTADGAARGSFWAPHTVCVDSHGDLYVGEVCYSFSGMGGSGTLPEGIHTLQKLARTKA